MQKQKNININRFWMKINNIKNISFIWVVILILSAFTPTNISSSTANYYEFFMIGNAMETTSAAAVKYPSVFDLQDQDKEWIEEKLSKLTLKEKVGQMIMPWMNGHYISEDSRDFRRISSLVRSSKVGGIIFFKGDVMNQANIINRMQEMSDIPLLISADFERGLAMRLTDATEFPYNMAVAATGETRLAYRMGKVIADESRAMGVHQNYAPVADINNNADNPIINIRAYSEDKDVVARFTSAFVFGSNEGRVLSTAKHFPGHGNTNIDSHADLPTINVDGLSIRSNELVPFEEAIRAGVHSIMIGHLEVPSLEPIKGLPATLSRAIITDLLKEEMGFDGLIVTDAMNMHAITKYYSVAQASIMAVKAGNDILLMPPDEDIAINAITDAVLNNEISEERINESVRKILAAKKWLKIEESKYSRIENLTSAIGIEPHIRLSEEIAEKSITLLRDPKSIIPIESGRYRTIASITITDGSGRENDRYFQNVIDKRFPFVRKVFLTRNSKPAEFQKALEVAASADLVIMPAFVKVRAYQGTVKMPENHINFIRKVIKLNTPSVLLSFGNPYLLSLFPDVDAYLCAYGDPKVSQAAMVKAITGDVDIQGIMPVSIPHTQFAMGSGIRTAVQSYTLADNKGENSYNFNDVEKLLNSGVADKVFPGGVLLIGKEGKIVYEKAFGNFTYDKSSTPMMTEAIFDLASVSKVVSTTSAAMILYDEGKLILEKNVRDYLPGFEANGKEFITIKNLLEHNSGLIAYRNYPSLFKTEHDVINSILNEKLEYPLGSKTVYSDLNMILLQKIIEKIAGMPLDRFVKERVFSPLNMERTMYNPQVEYYYYTPPTSETIVAGKRNKGVVHDGNAHILNGVAGHAGLFSTASDLSIFMQMMLQYGRYGNNQLIKPSTVREWTRVQSRQSSRALGWDTKSEEGSSAGKLFSKNSFGHTGFTGTSVWADRDRELFVILLTNRVYPDGSNIRILEFRPQLHDAVIKAIDK
jgi:beta-N-acetylhexosaminidase